MCIPCFAFCAWPTCGARFSCFARIPAFVPVSCPLGVACFVYYPGIACIACLACCVYPRGHPGFVRRGGFPCDARLMGVVWSGGVVRRGGVVRHGRRATRRARGRRPGRLGWRRIVLAAIGRLAGCAGWGLRMPARPAGARNGVGRTPGARFASSTRQRLADAFPGQSEIWGPERERETPVLPPESHARGRKSQSGVPVPERGSGALRGRAAFRVLRAACGPNSGLGGHTTEPRRHPSPTGVRREQVSLVEPSAQAGAGSSHGNSQYATATVAARTAAEPVSGRQRQLLAPRFAYRGWCSATPSARRPRSASAPIPRTAGSGAAANAKARSLVPVRVLMATSGPSRFTACCRPESPTTGHTAGDALRPGWTAVSRGDTRRRRETPASGQETPRGRLPEKEPAPSSRSRPRDHQRHVDDNPATAVHTGGQRSDSSIDRIPLPPRRAA